MNFSVLMSVYAKENPVFLDESLKSTLINQSLIPNELVLVKDGPLTNELEAIINYYEEKFTDIIKIIELETNQGLGRALRIGITQCSYDLVARMDSDDINHKLRFEKQIKYLKENPDLDLIGTNIAEFFENPEEIQFIRKVPCKNDEIKKRLRRRNPINHVSVMFKKSAVIKSGSYRHMYLLEDYYLWVRMIANGCKLENVNEALVYVRTGRNMFKRRSNPENIKSWLQLQNAMYKYKLIDKLDFFLNVINMVIFIYTPPAFKKYIYQVFLRKKPI